MIDYFYCRVRYGVSSNEYLSYKFYNYRDRYRKNFLLSQHRKKYINVNTNDFTGSKYVFYRYIPDLYSREIILAPFCGEEVFVQFLKKHKQIIIKPDTGSLGKGVHKIEYTDDTTAKDYFNQISYKNPMICEEFIRQHPVMKKLNPNSVNTIRIASLLQDGEVEILSATLKCGADGDIITDNLSIGGIGAQIDIPSGIVVTFGKTFNLDSFTHHPVSGMQIIGLQIPHWELAVDLVKKAHKRVPQCTIYGWDIAITETGVDIVEANDKTSVKIMQIMDGVPKGQNVLPLIKKDRLKDKRDVYCDDWLNRFCETYHKEKSSLKRIR